MLAAREECSELEVHRGVEWAEEGRDGYGVAGEKQDREAQ